MVDFFCPAPWTSVYISTIGAQTICCRSEEIRLFGPIDFNNEKIRKVRLDILNNKIPSTCEHCHMIEENNGIQSLRQVSIKANQNTTEAVVKENTDERGFVSNLHPIQYSLILGNKCNLKCMMCMPWCSSRWLEDWDNITKNQSQVLVDKEYCEYSFKKSKLFEWFNDPVVFENLWELISSGTEPTNIWCSGGEVLLNPMFKTLLQRVINHDRNNICLSVLSNGTTLKPDVESLLRQVPNLIMNYSVDGISKKGEYIRYPSNFSEVEKNIKKMNDKVGMIFITVSSVNIMDIGEVIEWCEDNGYKTNFEMVYGPLRYLNPLILPKKFRFYAADKLENLIGMRKLVYTKKSDIEGLIQMLRQPYGKQVISIRDFLDLMQKFDRIRNTNFMKTFPEWKKAIYS